MKKILITIAAVVLVAALILFFPIPKGTYDDGGSREYEALTYKIIRWNRLTNNGTYRKTRIYWGADKHLSPDELFAREKPYLPTVDDPPIPHTVNFEAQYIRTDGYHEDAVYPAVTLIRSADELTAYYKRNKDLYSLERRDDPASDSTIGFLDACDRYDKAFFDDHCLILILLQEASGSIRHKVTAVQQTADNVTVSISPIVPEVGTDDMAQWHIFVETDAVITEEQTILVAFPSDGNSHTPPREDVLYENRFAQVILPLPDGWDSEVLDDGIRFHPKGHEGSLCLRYMDAFGVCGTGLHSQTVTIGGYETEQGTYDDHALWDYIVFPQECYSVGDYVFFNEGAEGWWDDYGDEAMSILNSTAIYEKVTMEGKAIVFAKEVCNVEYDTVNAVFDTDRAVWEITFFKKEFLGGGQTVTVDGFSGEILEIQYGE
ncbi:MAG: hypothetical protein E7553_05350 [Ruminococcaceae bacterium]|nr:hypothetical protein [Oscillospiraceae bacterium]